MLERLKTHSQEILVLIGILFLLAFNLGLFAIDPYAEFFHLEAAKEMAASNQFWIPLLKGQDYLSRGPFWTWIVFVCFKILGIQLWVARIPAIFFALVSLVFTYLLANQLSQSKITGFFAAAVLGSIWGFSHQSLLSTADVAVTALFAAFSWIFARWQSVATKRYAVSTEINLYALLLGLMAGFVFLLKGTLSTLLLLGAAGVYLQVSQAWPALRQLQWKRFWLGFLALTLPWLLLVSMLSKPSLLWDYVIAQPFEQWVGLGPWQTLERDIFFYLKLLPFNTLPYLFFMIALFTDQALMRRENAVTRQWLKWCLIWFAMGFGIYSLSALQEPTALLPFYIPLAVLTAYYLGRMFERGDATPTYTTCIAVYVIALMASAVLLTVFIFQVLPDNYVLGFWKLPGIPLLTEVGFGPISIPLEEPIPLWKFWLIPGPLILVTGGTVLYFLMENRRLHLAGVALCCTTLVFLLFVKVLYLPALNRPLSLVVAQRLNHTVESPRDRILLYSTQPELKRVMFYLHPRLTPQVRFVQQPAEFNRFLKEAGKRHIYGVIRENSFYRLSPEVRERLRIDYVDWKWDLGRSNELWKFALLRLPVFDHMKTHLILFEVLPQKMMQSELEQEPTPTLLH